MLAQFRKNLVWNITVAVGAIVIGGLSLGLIEWLGSKMYPAENLDIAGLSASEIETKLKMYLQNAPVGALLFVVLAHAVGAVVATVLGCLLGRGTKFPGFIAGGVLWGLTVLNLFSVPHPVWFMALDMAIVILAVLVPLSKIRK